MIPHLVVFQPKIDQNASWITGVIICEMKIKGTSCKVNIFSSNCFLLSKNRSLFLRCMSSHWYAPSHIWQIITIEILLICCWQNSYKMGSSPCLQHYKVQSMYVMLSLPELMYLYKRSEMRCHYKAMQNTSFLLFLLFYHSYDEHLYIKKKTVLSC